MKANWPTVPLTQAVMFRGGGTPPKKNPKYWGGPIPWVSPKDMKSAFVDSSQDTITRDALAGSAVKVIPEGATLIVVRSGILARTVPVAVAARELTVNQDLKALVPGEQVDPRFLHYFMQSAEPYLLSRVTRGATVHKLDSEVLESLQVPLPSRGEQQCIVAILDEAFAGIATAVANTEKNLANARRLFESYLNAVFSQRGEGWTESPLETLVTDSCTLSYGIVQPGSDVRGGIPVVRPTDLRQKLIRRDTLKTIDPSLAKAYSRTTLHGGDLLLCVRGTTGDLSVAATELEGANVTRGIVPIRFNPSLLNQELGYHLLRSPFVQDQIAEKTYGAALMQINIKDVRKLLVLVPPHETHEELCSCLNDFSAETDQLQSIYGQKHNALSELKKSLLQKAFSGELTAGKAAADAMRQVEEIA